MVPYSAVDAIVAARFGRGGSHVDAVAAAVVTACTLIFYCGPKIENALASLTPGDLARAPALSKQISEFQGKLRKARADEAMMLRAVQELRKKMVEDEMQLESATQRVKVRTC